MLQVFVVFSAFQVMKVVARYEIRGTIMLSWAWFVCVCVCVGCTDSLCAMCLSQACLGGRCEHQTQAERHEGELSDAKRVIGEQRKKIEVESSPLPH
jgi:hypothetical protein